MQLQNYVCGKNACLECLNKGSLKIKELILQNRKEGVRSEYQPALDFCTRHKIPVKKVSKESLNKMLECDSHQGICFVLKDLPYTDCKSQIKQTEAQSSSLVVMLDSIYDPHNFGALMRVAEVFSADAIIWSKNRGASITPAVHKASVGASVLINKVLVSNLSDAILKYKKAGYWVVCASVGEGSQAIDQFSFPEKTLLILGSEGKGVQKSLEKQADFKVFIPMLGNIDSLNVSQAAACFAYEFRKQFALS
ncbi:MAG: 23S rRNA (guanosine(2251)-2'-O)-methyltransferase RlmB [Chlamydiales bacterium]|nr:23S rRNA (guanosine(2251)-2'-O)-methyltransferase RlmB [Chlamydiales bacterium]NCF70434.1 23S rRNA (guanosine(2251)-2'-O)-methyltransferase RlmB [Chlamydiales bacterium]